MQPALTGSRSGNLHTCATRPAFPPSSSLLHTARLSEFSLPLSLLLLLLLFACYLLSYFDTRSHYVALGCPGICHVDQACLKLLEISLPLPPKDWDPRCARPILGSSLLTLHSVHCPLAEYQLCSGERQGRGVQGKGFCMPHRSSDCEHSHIVPSWQSMASEKAWLPKRSESK